MSEMQTKNQVEDSIIQESLLTCIDLANSDLHQSALLLKKVCIHLFLLLFYFVRNQWFYLGSFLFQACLDSGFFYVINHGISKEVTDKAFEQSKKFFALPLEEKMKVLKNEKHRGYTPLYDQIPDPENQVKGMCNQFSLQKVLLKCSPIMSFFFFGFRGSQRRLLHWIRSSQRWSSVGSAILWPQHLA